MYFTFAKEPLFGVDATTQDFTVDLLSDDVITNVNYSKLREFNQPTPKSRYAGVKSSAGRIALELTYDNLGWNTLYEVLVGKKVNIDGYAFAKSSEHWNIVTGMLAGDLDATSETFTITEYKSGEFDNVNGIIVGGEYIAVTTISSGGATASTRASEGTTAAPHVAQDLVYGVIASGGNSIDIIYRYRDGYCYSLSESLTTMIEREGDLFKFNGTLFSDYVFNAQPGQNDITSSFEMSGINTDVITLSSQSVATDNGSLVSFNDINCYCMNQWLDVEKLYFQVSNTLNPGPGKFLDSTMGSFFVGSFSAYGQFSLVEESLEAYNSYIGNDFKNVSITMCDSRQFSKAYVFAFNNARYGTMLHILRDNDFIIDSVPFFSYGPDTFFILIQN